MPDLSALFKNEDLPAINFLPLFIAATILLSCNQQRKGDGYNYPNIHRSVFIDSAYHTLKLKLGKADFADLNWSQTEVIRLPDNRTVLKINSRSNRSGMFFYSKNNGQINASLVILQFAARDQKSGLLTIRHLTRNRIIRIKFANSKTIQKQYFDILAGKLVEIKVPVSKVKSAENQRSSSLATLRKDGYPDLLYTQTEDGPTSGYFLQGKDGSKTIIEPPQDFVRLLPLPARAVSPSTMAIAFNKDSKGTASCLELYSLYLLLGDPTFAYEYVSRPSQRQETNGYIIPVRGYKEGHDPFWIKDFTAQTTMLGMPLQGSPLSSITLSPALGYTVNAHSHRLNISPPNSGISGNTTRTEWKQLQGKVDYTKGTEFNWEIFGLLSVKMPSVNSSYGTWYFINGIYNTANGNYNLTVSTN